MQRIIFRKDDGVVVARTDGAKGTEGATYDPKVFTIVDVADDTLPVGQPDKKFAWDGKGFTERPERDWKDERVVAMEALKAAFDEAIDKPTPTSLAAALLELRKLLHI